MFERVLKQFFGYDSFRDGQREIITAIADGHDVLAVLPTGAGKSLTFQFPSYLLNNGLTVIVSPLLSLIEDQMLHIRARGEKRVARLTSMESAEEKRTILSNLHSYRYLYLSPEQLALPHVMQALSANKVSLLVIDEAHCISQWGNEFRPEYAKLGELRQRLGSPQCMAVTATAPETVKQDIMQKLALFSPEVFIHSANRPELRLVVERPEASKKLERLKQLVALYPKPIVVYTATRRDAEELAQTLDEAMYYHGGMSLEDRRLVQSQFLQDEIAIMVCTSAFGMGVNKSNVRTVIHYQIPATVEAYMQEIGRAGRDGNTAYAVLLYAEKDEVIQQFLIRQQYPKEDVLKEAYAAFEHGAGFDTIQRQLRLGQDSAVLGLLRQLLQERTYAEAKAWIAERKRDRYRQLGQMMDYALISTCRRAYLLRYFSEVPTPQEQCCDRCDTIIIEQDTYAGRKVAVDWEDRLQRIFALDHLGEG